MADPILLKQAVLAALKAIPGLAGRVYDGAVVGAIPVDKSGYVLPYVVLFAGIGDHPNEVYLDGRTGTDGLIFDFQTTCVGPGTSQAAGVAADARRTLTNLRVGTGRIRPNPDGFTQPLPVREENTTPVRYMLPVQWRLHTN